MPFDKMYGLHVSLHDSQPLYTIYTERGQGEECSATVSLDVFMEAMIAHDLRCREVVLSDVPVDLAPRPAFLCELFSFNPVHRSAVDADVVKTEVPVLPETRLRFMPTLLETRVRPELLLKLEYDYVYLPAAQLASIPRHNPHSTFVLYAITGEFDQRRLLFWSKKSTANTVKQVKEPQPDHREQDKKSEQQQEKEVSSYSARGPDQSDEQSTDQPDRPGTPEPQPEEEPVLEPGLTFARIAFVPDQLAYAFKLQNRTLKLLGLLDSSWVSVFRPSSASCRSRRTSRTLK